MATFFKRKIKKLAASLQRDDTPSSMALSTPAGVVTLSKTELHRYGLLHSMLSSDMSGEIGNGEAATFLKRSGLVNEDLHAVWNLMSNVKKQRTDRATTKGKIGKEDFLLCCRLVAFRQHNEEALTLEAITDTQRGRGGGGMGLADFRYGVNPDESLGGSEAGSQAEFPEASIRILVHNPQTFGTGLDTHTRFQVDTQTSLSDRKSVV